MFLVIVTVMFASFVGIFFISNYNQLAFGFEENILALQNGIISTKNHDYAISQEFETRIIQDGRIMRLSGITTTGEQYYLYQKIVEDDTIVRGKIFENNAFVPLIFNEKFFEEKIQQGDTNLAMVVKLSEFTYSNYRFVISVKVFDLERNPTPDYHDRTGIIENAFVNVTITDRFDEYITHLSGNTDYRGVFEDNYLVIEDNVGQGEFNVDVMIDDGTSNINQLFTTYFRGDIRDYFADDPNP